MEYQAWFQCSEGCDEQYPLSEIVYRCENCGSLLEVRHDLDLLKQQPASEWMNLFDRRYMRTEWPYGSSVWGKKEIVCPVVENENVVSMYEGGSNLFWAERFGREINLKNLWIKQCGNSHTGSFKDLGMTVLVSMVKQMRSDGQAIRAIACASTGDTSASLAAYCAAAEIPAIVFLPRDKISYAQLIQPIANGAITLALDTDFDGCMALVQKVCADEGIYLANSMNSLRIEGQKTVAIEIVQQFDWQVPDWVIIPGGNLGNVTALGLGFLMMKNLGIIDRLPRIVCAQAAKANPLYQSYLNGFKEFHSIVAQPTLASAIQIGNPVSFKRATRTLQMFNGIVEQATEDELANAAARADRAGLFNCPHTGVALAVLIKLVDRGLIRPDEQVVVISTANGLKFPEFKIKYHEGRLPEVDSKYVNRPLELAADYDSVMRTLSTVLVE
ncbi:MAG: threonine synthase [Candidatus Tectomicrobia bacterium]|nr:threonine synthase [Candidatus Tectomicrobia bacterium]